MLNQDAMHSRPRRSPPAAAPVPTMPPSRRSKRARNTLKYVFPLEEAPAAPGGRPCLRDKIRVRTEVGQTLFVCVY